MLAGIVMLLVGIFGGSPTALGVGVALAGLGGLEVAAREHFAGLILAICLGIGAAAFLVAFFALRRVFQRASGGLSFRVGRFGGG